MKSNDADQVLLERFAHVEITDEEIPAPSPHQQPKQLGEHQRFVLGRVIEHGGWYLGCSWNPYAIIEYTLRALERRGLVSSENRETPIGRRTVYTATDAGCRILT